MLIEEKFQNFKNFVKEISRNDETMKLCQDMTFLKLQALSYTLLLPNKHKLDEILKGMQEKLDFDDEHLPKFKRYLELFIEYLGGSIQEQQPPAYITSTSMTIEERMALYLKESQRGN